MTTPIVSVDQLCVAIEQLLTDRLDATMTALGFADLKQVSTWQQVPSVAALSAATLPAGAIVSPGLVSPPSYKASTGLYEATWRVPVGIYTKGRDHDSTQAAVRNWCAGIRLTVLQHKSLGGLAKSLAWTGEEYDRIASRESARTIAVGGCAFDVTALMTTDLTAGVLPTVTTTPTTLSVR